MTNRVLRHCLSFSALFPLILFFTYAGSLQAQLPELGMTTKQLKQLYNHNKFYRCEDKNYTVISDITVNDELGRGIIVMDDHDRLAYFMWHTMQEPGSNALHDKFEKFITKAWQSEPKKLENYENLFWGKYGKKADGSDDYYLQLYPFAKGTPLLLQMGYYGIENFMPDFDCEFADYLKHKMENLNNPPVTPPKK